MSLFSYIKDALCSKNSSNFVPIWVISDDSHRQQQAIALADALGKEYKIYSYSEININNIKPCDFPHIIIGAGADAAKTALQIKQLSNEKSYAICILDPMQEHENFDLIIVPDYEPHHQGDNVITTTGLLNRINPKLLQQAKIDFDKGQYPELKLANLPPPFITVLVGGDYIGGKFEEEDIIKFCSQIDELAKKQGASILISTSKRTNNVITKTIEKNLTSAHFLYDQNNSENIKNPYSIMLELADEIIATGDSIRMCCEACATGKSVHIFIPEHEFQPYAPLYQQLADMGYTKILDGKPMNNCPTAALNEAQQIADHIGSSGYMNSEIS